MAFHHRFRKTKNNSWCRNLPHLLEHKTSNQGLGKKDISLNAKLIWLQKHRTLTLHWYGLHKCSIFPLSLVYQNNLWRPSFHNVHDHLAMGSHQPQHPSTCSRSNSPSTCSVWLQFADFVFPRFTLLHWQPNSSFHGLLVQYKLTKEKKTKEMIYEISSMSYPCFGTVLALWDVFLHLIHLQLMREIPDQQLLWMRCTARQMDC